MRISSNNPNSLDSFELNSPFLNFTRKPFHKNTTKIPLLYNNGSENTPLTNLQFPSLELKISQTSRNKTNIEKKIFSLLELGLSPKIEQAHKKALQYKASKKSRIMLSDFMPKNAQKQILSFHNLEDLKLENSKSIGKEKLSGAFSFGSLKGDNYVYVRNSSELLSLPLINRTEGKVDKDYIENREGKMKKIEIIMESCEDFLKDSRTERKKRGSLPPLFWDNQRKSI